MKPQPPIFPDPCLVLLPEILLKAIARLEKELPEYLAWEREAVALVVPAERKRDEEEAAMARYHEGILPPGDPVTPELIQAYLAKGELDLIIAKGRAKQARLNAERMARQTTITINSFLKKLPPSLVFDLTKKATKMTAEVFAYYFPALTGGKVSELYETTLSSEYLSNLTRLLERAQTGRPSPNDHSDGAVRELFALCAFLKMSPLEYSRRPR